MIKIVPILIIILLRPIVVDAQDMRETVDLQKFFLEEPAWVVGFRMGAGYEMKKSVYPKIDILFGYTFSNHLYLGANLNARPISPHYVSLEFQSGVMFRSSKIFYGTGFNLGVLTVPLKREVGFVPVPWAELRFQISSHQLITLNVTVQMLFTVFGFKETRTLISGGIGWLYFF